MDLGRCSFGHTAGRQALMAKLLEVSLPLLPQEYDADLMIQLVSDIETALTRTEIPSVISGEDDTNSLNWFMG